MVVMVTWRLATVAKEGFQKVEKCPFLYLKIFPPRKDLRMWNIILKRRKIGLLGTINRKLCPSSKQIYGCGNIMDFWLSKIARKNIWDNLKLELESCVDFNS